MPHSPAVPDAIAALVSPLDTSETDGTVTAAPEQDGHGFPTPPATQPLRLRAAILRDLTSLATGAERAAAGTGARRVRRGCGSTSPASPGSQRPAREEPGAVFSRGAAAARRAANEARSLPGTRVAVVPAAVDHRLTEAIKYFLQGMGYMAASAMTRLSRSCSGSVTVGEGERGSSRSLSRGSTGGGAAPPPASP